MDKVQAGLMGFTGGLWIGARKPVVHEFEVIVAADELPEPVIEMFLVEISPSVTHTGPREVVRRLQGWDLEQPLEDPNNVSVESLE